MIMKIVYYVSMVMFYLFMILPKLIKQSIKVNLRMKKTAKKIEEWGGVVNKEDLINRVKYFINKVIEENGLENIIRYVDTSELEINFPKNFDKKNWILFLTYIDPETKRPAIMIDPKTLVCLGLLDGKTLTEVLKVGLFHEYKHVSQYEKLGDKFYAYMEYFKNSYFSNPCELEAYYVGFSQDPSKIAGTCLQ